MLAGFGSALAWAVFADEQDCALSPTSERRKASLSFSLCLVRGSGGGDDDDDGGWWWRWWENDERDYMY